MSEFEKAIIERLDKIIALLEPPQWVISTNPVLGDNKKPITVDDIRQIDDAIKATDRRKRM